MKPSQIQPDHLLTVLDEHREQLNTFCRLLIAENKKYNLTRIDSPEQVRIRHFLDSLAGLSILDELSKEIENPLRILDIGSGAGFPALVLAIVRPEWKIVSLEATSKKIQFQKMVCDEIGLNNVIVLHDRAETLAHNTHYREQFDAVTARALASMPILAELSLAFVKVDGSALFWKGPGEDIDAANNAIQQMGAQFENVLEYTLPTEDTEPPKFSLVICKKIKTTPKQHPRVFGIIKKKPLS